MRNKLPSLYQLVEFFGVGPSDVIPDEALSTFHVSNNGAHLFLSISEVARSFQTNICVGDAMLSSVVFEGLGELLLLGDKVGPFMLAKFDTGGAEIKCVVRVQPNLSVEWSGITD